MRITFVLAATVALAATFAQAETITVFAAASLKGPLDAAAAAWKTSTGNEATISYGGSSALAKQIEAAAPADVFLSAAENWMDKLSDEKLIKADSRHDFWGNTLVLVSHDPATALLTLDKNTDIVAVLGQTKLAMALVDSVPAGQYGKEALTSLGLWDKAEPSVVQAEDVKAALKLVSSGEAGFGVVYATDARAAKTVTVVATFPEDSHKPIAYPGAVVTSSTKPEAQAFLDFLKTPAARDLFGAAGFTLLP